MMNNLTSALVQSERAAFNSSPTEPSGWGNRAQSPRHGALMRKSAQGQHGASEEKLTDWNGNMVKGLGNDISASTLSRADSGLCFEKLPAPRPKVRPVSDAVLTPVKRRELQLQQQLLHELHKDYNIKKSIIEENDIKLQNFELELQDIRDMIADLSKKTNGAKDSVSQHSIQAATLKRLHDQATKHLLYSKKLMFMLERSQRNKIVSESRLDQIKISIGANRKELQAHILNLREAENMERIASRDLENAQKSARDLEIEWGKRVADKEEAMKETNEILEFREQQLAKKTAIIAEVKGDLDADGEQKLQRKVVTNKMKQLRLANDIAKKTEQIDQYERAFKRIVEATGINDMNQVVEKFLSQHDTSENLKEMIEEANAKIAILAERRAEQKKNVEKFRFAGFGQSSVQRKLIDEKEEAIEGSIKANKILYERARFLEEVLRGIQDGILHISTQLDRARIPIPSVDGSDALHSVHAIRKGLGTVLENTGTISEEPATDPDNQASMHTHPSGSNQNAKGEPRHVAINDLDWFIHSLDTCERRIVKIIESVPHTNLRINDIEPEVLESFGQAKVMINLANRRRSRARSSIQPKRSRRISGKPRSSKGGGKEDDRKKSKRMTMMLQNSNTKRKGLLDTFEKQRVHLQDCQGEADAAEATANKLEQLGEASREEIQQAFVHAEKLRADARHAATILNNIRTRIDGHDQEVQLQLTKESGSSKSIEETPAKPPSECSDSEIDSDSSDWDEDDDEFERCVPVIGVDGGRELIKQENEKLLKFADKKRKRVSKAVLIDEALIEQEVLLATKEEARRDSAVRAKHHTRLSFIKNKYERAQRRKPTMVRNRGSVIQAAP